MSGYEWPPDDVLRASVEAHGVSWTARELDCGSEALRRHMGKRGLPTKAAPRKLEASDAMKKVAELL